MFFFRKPAFVQHNVIALGYETAIIKWTSSVAIEDMPNKLCFIYCIWARFI